MKLKKAILSVLNRDGLRQVVDDFELDGVDKRSPEEMRRSLSRSRKDFSRRISSPERAAMEMPHLVP